MENKEYCGLYLEISLGEGWFWGAQNPEFRGAVCEQHLYGSVRAGMSNHPGYSI